MAFIGIFIQEFEANLVQSGLSEYAWIDKYLANVFYIRKTILSRVANYPNARIIAEQLYETTNSIYQYCLELTYHDEYKRNVPKYDTEHNILKYPYLKIIDDENDHWFYDIIACFLYRNDSVFEKSYELFCEISKYATISCDIDIGGVIKNYGSEVDRTKA